MRKYYIFPLDVFYDNDLRNYILKTNKTYENRLITNIFAIFQSISDYLNLSNDDQIIIPETISEKHLKIIKCFFEDRVIALDSKDYYTAITKKLEKLHPKISPTISKTFYSTTDRYTFSYMREMLEKLGWKEADNPFVAELVHQSEVARTANDEMYKEFRADQIHLKDWPTIDEMRRIIR